LITWWIDCVALINYIENLCVFTSNTRECELKIPSTSGKKRGVKRTLREVSVMERSYVVLC
jgi:hypothetical protein